MDRPIPIPSDLVPNNLPANLPNNLPNNLVPKLRLGTPIRQAPLGPHGQFHTGNLDPTNIPETDHVGKTEWNVG